MVDQREEPISDLAARRAPVVRKPEELWVRSFLEFTGTENVTRFCQEDLNGVSLTRAVEALRCGELVWSEKCEGAGTICSFEHGSDDDVVEVLMWFSSVESKLEIRRAMRVEENGREPDDAA
jgi:hypothetical protein